MGYDDVLLQSFCHATAAWTWGFGGWPGVLTERFQLKLMYVELIGAPVSLANARAIVLFGQVCASPCFRPLVSSDEIYLFLTFNSICFQGTIVD